VEHLQKSNTVQEQTSEKYISSLVGDFSKQTRLNGDRRGISVVVIEHVLRLPEVWLATFRQFIQTLSGTGGKETPTGEGERRPTDQLEDCPRSNKPPRHSSPKANRRSSRSGSQRPKQRRNISNAKLLLIVALLEHHKFSTEEFHRQPATQKQLENVLRWTQSRVSRTMAVIFGKRPMAKYRSLCKLGRIRGFLEKLEDGTHRIDGIINPPEDQDCDEDIHF